MAPDPHPPLASYQDFAALFDYPLLQPDLTAAQVLQGLERARRSGVATVTVRPCDIDLAVRTLQGSAVKAGCVVGFPHGSQTTAVKLYEGRDLLRRGARELDLVIGIPSLLSREFQHVQTELMQMSEACHKEGALLKVILETGYLPDDLKIIACGCCERAEVDFVSTSTGFGPAGNTLADIDLLRRHLPEEIQVKAEADLATVDQILKLHEAGCTRVSTRSTEAILAEWKTRPQTQT
ncbi:MAG TPA: deoxyribose-phosphate aldolase [Candidatus Sulfopaludibacter sp.]|nr:deoxyribose-phosphate aldolase [Candidatus Sulfopaludibacter sp.]